MKKEIEFEIPDEFPDINLTGLDIDIDFIKRLETWKERFKSCSFSPFEFYPFSSKRERR